MAESTHLIRIFFTFEYLIRSNFYFDDKKKRIAFLKQKSNRKVWSNVIGIQFGLMLQLTIKWAADLILFGICCREPHIWLGFTSGFNSPAQYRKKDKEIRNKLRGTNSNDDQLRSNERFVKDITHFFVFFQFFSTRN